MRLRISPHTMTHISSHWSSVTYAGFKICVSPTTGMAGLGLVPILPPPPAGGVVGVGKAVKASYDNFFGVHPPSVSTLYTNPGFSDFPAGGCFASTVMNLGVRGPSTMSGRNRLLASPTCLRSSRLMSRITASSHCLTPLNSPGYQ